MSVLRQRLQEAASSGVRMLRLPTTRKGTEACRGTAIGCRGPPRSERHAPSPTFPSTCAEHRVDGSPRQNVASLRAPCYRELAVALKNSRAGRAGRRAIRVHRGVSRVASAILLQDRYRRVALWQSALMMSCDTRSASVSGSCRFWPSTTISRARRPPVLRFLRGMRSRKSRQQARSSPVRHVRSCSYEDGAAVSNPVDWDAIDHRARRHDGTLRSQLRQHVLAEIVRVVRVAARPSVPASSRRSRREFEAKLGTLDCTASILDARLGMDLKMRA